MYSGLHRGEENTVRVCVCGEFVGGNKSLFDRDLKFPEFIYKSIFFRIDETLRMGEMIPIQEGGGGCMYKFVAAVLGCNEAAWMMGFEWVIQDLP